MCVCDYKTEFGVQNRKAFAFSVLSDSRFCDLYFVFYLLNATCSAFGMVRGNALLPSAGGPCRKSWEFHENFRKGTLDSECFKFETSKHGAQARHCTSRFLDSVAHGSLASLPNFPGVATSLRLRSFARSPALVHFHDGSGKLL